MGSRHKQVTQTGSKSSWLNQVEIWFSFPSGESFNGASFKSIEPLEAHINAFIADHNEHARPFAWTRRNMHQKRLKPCFTD
jgi:hypothetical protein